MTLDDWSRAQLVDHLADLNRALEGRDAVVLVTVSETVAMTDDALRDAVIGTANHLGHVIRGVG